MFRRLCKHALGNICFHHKASKIRSTRFPPTPVGGGRRRTRQHCGNLDCDSVSTVGHLEIWIPLAHVQIGARLKVISRSMYADAKSGCSKTIGYILCGQSRGRETRCIQTPMRILAASKPVLTKSGCFVSTGLLVVRMCFEIITRRVSRPRGCSQRTQTL